MKGAQSDKYAVLRWLGRNSQHESTEETCRKLDKTGCRVSGCRCTDMEVSCSNRKLFALKKSVTPFKARFLGYILKI